jgi:hypothetical protein
MRERKEVLDNSVYSEILIKINNKKVYALDFIKKFNRKERSVLARQLQVLYDTGYLKYEDLKDKEEKKKYKGNLKYYYIDFKKILEDFYKVLIGFLDVRKDFQLDLWKKDNIHYKDFLVEYERVKSKRFKNNLISNKIFMDYIGYFFEEVDKIYEDVRFKDITLRKLFLEILEYGLYDSFDLFINLHLADKIRIKRDNLDANKLNKNLEDIKFMSEYYWTLERLGFGSKILDELSARAVDKVETKYLK